MKKYYIYTFGCKVNQYESQLISEKFKGDNFKGVQRPEDADIIIFNTCTVTEQADKKCEYFLRKALKLVHKPKIVLTGCIVKNKNSDMKDLFPGIEIVEDKTDFFTDPRKQKILGFDEHSRAFLKIQDGCDTFCSYCIVPYVRNVLWSKPENEIISEIENLVRSGYPEIVLTGICLGKYNNGLSPLVEKIVKLSLDFRVRISSVELNDVNDRLTKVMRANPDKICRHLHIPLQSGSDVILKQMNRKYSVKEFERKTDKIMHSLPDLALTTDIIAGFPGEDEKRHRETCDFIKRIPFARFHIFRYSDRHITKASTFANKVPEEEVKNRAKELFEIDFLKRKDFISKNIGAKRKAVKTGREKVLTDNYITVKTHGSVDGDRQKRIFEVEITDTSEI